jgi:hypothetical protein
VIICATVERRSLNPRVVTGVADPVHFLGAGDQARYADIGWPHPPNIA